MAPRPGRSSRALLLVRAGRQQGNTPRRLLEVRTGCGGGGGQHLCYSTVGLARNHKRGRPGLMGALASSSWADAAAVSKVGSEQHHIQRRGLASASGGGGEGAGAEAAAAVGSKGVLLYKGAHGDVIRTLKRVSLTTCAIGLASSPFFLALGSEAVPLAANAALTSIVLLATCGPTVLLHAFTKPYIFALRRLPPPSPATETTTTTTTSDAGANRSSSKNDPRFRAETMDFLTRRAFSEFQLAQVKPLPNTTRPFATFEANGRLYFVHGETFADKALLQKLVGRPLREAETVPVEPPEDEEEED